MVRTLASALAGVAVASLPAEEPPQPELELALQLSGIPDPPDRSWDPRATREQLIGLLPGGALEQLARTLADRRVQLRLERDHAFVQVRISL